MGSKKQKRLYYIVEKQNWSIKWDGYYITQIINRLNTGIKAKLAYHPKRKRNSIVHFGSRNLYLPNKYQKVHHSNKMVLTWFHGSQADKNMNETIPLAAEKADWVHTSCEISRQFLLNLGIPSSKIVKIPLGVDLNLFSPVTATDKRLLRKQHDIPDNYTVIGSFQKDGEGWEDGLKPKWVKGPETFCDVIELLHKQYPVFVLLSGPARGYVKERLRKSGILYAHYFYKDYRQIPRLYKMLDIYLVSSRVEGGPKAILESMASGIPLVSTKAGMAPEIIQDGENGFLAEVDDSEKLTQKVARLIENNDLKTHFSRNGIITSKNYSYYIIGKQYYELLYKNLFL